MKILRHSTVALAAVALLALDASAAVPAGLKGAGADADKWLMNNADFVLAVNVKQLAGSAVMTKGGADAVKALVQMEPKAAAAFEAAGIEPLKDIDSVLFSGSVGAKTSDAKGVVVVRGRFDAEKAFAAAKKNADKVEVVKEGTLSMMKLKVQDHDAFAAFAGKDTLVITHSKESTASWVKNGGKTEARMSAAMKTSLEGFKGTETVTFALVLTDSMRQMIAKVPQVAVAGQKMQTVTASLNVTDQADLKATVATSDAKGARQLQGALGVLKGLGEVMVSADETYGPMISDILNEVKISSDGKDVRIDLKVDKAVVEKASKKKD